MTCHCNQTRGLSSSRSLKQLPSTTTLKQAGFGRNKDRVLVQWLAPRTHCLTGQKQRSQQLSAAATHLGRTMPCPPPSMISASDCIDGPIWLIWKRCSPLENMLDTSELKRLKPLPSLASFWEFKVPLSDCRTSEHWEPVKSERLTSSTFFGTIELFSFGWFFMFRKRPPDPRGRRIAWRWRDSCIYGCKTDMQSISAGIMWILVLHRTKKSIWTEGYNRGI